jgi:hypothetical protein
MIDRSAQDSDSQLSDLTRILGNSIYGFARAAFDRMSSDMVRELRARRIAVASL